MSQPHPSPALAAVPHDVRTGVAAIRACAEKRFGDRVRRVRLYGSYARGDNDSRSDVDVYVELRDLTESERAWLFELAGEVSIELLRTFQVFAPRPDELAWLRKNECRIVADIDTEGIDA